MPWILPAIIAPMFFATVNHIDKHLLSRFFKGGGAGSLVLFSSFIGIFVMLFIFIFGTDVTAISIKDAGILLINGMLYMACIVPYFHALTKDETSVVAPLAQMISPISYVLGVVILHEQLATSGIFGGLLIAVGAVILSSEITERKKITLKKNVFLLMLLASTLAAVNGVLFKVAAVENASFWTSAFWEYTGVVIFGIIAFVTIPSYRKQFLEILRENNISIIGLNGINEVCAVSGKLLLHFATLLAPLASASFIAQGFQPFFVFVFGIILTLLFPRHVVERLEKQYLVQKISAILIMFVGTYLLST